MPNTCRWNRGKKATYGKQSKSYDLEKRKVTCQAPANRFELTRTNGNHNNLLTAAKTLLQPSKGRQEVSRMPTVWGSCFSLGSRRSPPSAAAAAPHSSLLITHSLTHSLISLTHSLPHSHSLPPSLPHSLTHSLTQDSLTHSLTPSLTHSSLSLPPSLPHSLTHSPHSPHSLTHSHLTHQAGAVQRACLLRGRRSTQSLLAELRRAWPPLGPRLPLAWQAQYTEPPGRAAARVAAAGAAAAFGVAGAVHRASWTSCGARGRRWGRGCLWRGRRSTQSLHSCLAAAGAAAAFRVAGAVHSLLEELRRAWPPLGPRLPFAWQAQYTEPPGRAAARVAAAGAAAAFGVAGAVHRASWTSCGARGRRWGRGCLSRGRRSTQSLHIIFDTLSFSHQFVSHHLSHQLWHHLSHTNLSTLTHHIFHKPLCPTPSFTHSFVTHHLAQTTLSHTIFHTPLCHTPSFTHNFATHHLSHTTLSHTIFHTPLCHTPSFTHHLWHTIFVSTLSHTINTIFHTPSLTHHLSHTTLSHTIFHTHHLSHTPHHLSHTIFDTTSLTHTHTPSFTHRHRPFFTHHLSHTTLSHTIFDTPSFTHNFVTHHLSPHHLCHTPSFTQTTLSHTIFPPPLPLSFLPSPSPQQDFLLNIGRSWLVGLSGPFISGVKVSVWIRMGGARRHTLFPISTVFFHVFWRSSAKKIKRFLSPTCQADSRVGTHSCVWTWNFWQRRTSAWPHVDPSDLLFKVMAPQISSAASKTHRISACLSKAFWTGHVLWIGMGASAREDLIA